MSWWDLQMYISPKDIGSRGLILLQHYPVGQKKPCTGFCAVIFLFCTFLARSFLRVTFLQMNCPLGLFFIRRFRFRTFVMAPTSNSRTDRERGQKLGRHWFTPSGIKLLPMRLSCANAVPEKDRPQVWSSPSWSNFQLIESQVDQNTEPHNCSIS